MAIHKKWWLFIALVLLIGLAGCRSTYTPVFTGIRINPPSANLVFGATQKFAAVALD